MAGQYYYKPSIAAAFLYVFAQAACFAPAAIAAPAAPAALPPQSIMRDMKSLLIVSQVAPWDQMRTDKDGTALYWTENHLHGSARELTPQTGEDLTKTAQTYLQGESSACKGQFVQKIGQPQTARNMAMLQVDTVCINGADNVATASLFIADHGSVGLIAQQGTVSQLPVALANRDDLVSAASGAVDLRDVSVPAAVPVLEPQPPQKMAAEQASPAPAPQSPAPPKAAAEQEALPQTATSSSWFESPRHEGLETLPGLTAGLDISRYKYRERTASANPFVNLSSYPMGAEASYTSAALPSFYNIHLRLGGRFAFGPAKYSSDGSGTASGEANNIWEIRGLIGKDFIFSPVAFSPYTGYGFRYLYNDGRGMSSLGAAGYRRQSSYQYIPVGLTSRLKLSDAARLAVNTEYDFFTSGTQKSYLSDANSAYGNIVNHQRRGFGLRGGIQFQESGWSIGPWFNYWHIDASDTVLVPGGGGLTGQEPNNTTTEIGLKITKTIW